MVEIVLSGLRKSYNGVEAVKHLDLTIHDKEFLVLVGPSGCGKTTALRMLAGLEDVTEGDIIIDGAVVNDMTPKERDVAMVFQNYALYPHMTVYQNLEFCLTMRRYSSADARRRIDEVAAILNIAELLPRKPSQLSGGQRQRVAVGRAIVRHPRLFLFDEPLSNLDAKLRAHMRSELKRLHYRLGATAVYVTHDQVEAMTLGDRVVVMRDGLIQQVGKPLDVYENPANMFVAGFIGSPSMNLFRSMVVRESGGLMLRAPGIAIQVPAQQIEFVEPYAGREITVGIRPEHLLLVGEQDSERHDIEAVVEVLEPLGAEVLVDLAVENKNVTMRTPAHIRLELGQALRVRCELSGLRFFDPETEERLGEPVAELEEAVN